MLSRLLVPILVLIGPTSCGNIKTNSIPHVTLTLKWLYDPGFAGEMIAERAGIFTKENVEVEIQPGGFEVDPIRLVAGGASEFGVAGADSFLIARSRGVPIVALAAGYIRTPVAYYYKRESGIKSLSDFQGRVIGLQAGQDTETLLYAMLGQAGIDRSKMTFFPVKYDLSPFLRGQVDVWPGYVATQSYILNSQGVAFDMIRPEDVGLIVPGTVYFTSESYLRQHPDVALRFIRAIKAGWRETYRDTAAAAPLISSFDRKALPISMVLANLRDQKDQVIPEGYQFGEMRRADWDMLYKVLLDQGLLKGPVDLDAALKQQ